MKPTPEFQPGDFVTYKPYDQEFPAMVKNFVVSLPRSREMKYKLVTVPGSSQGVSAITTGRSIKESQYYEDYDPKKHI